MLYFGFPLCPFGAVHQIASALESHGLQAGFIGFSLALLCVPLRLFAMGSLRSLFPLSSISIGFLWASTALCCFSLAFRQLPMGFRGFSLVMFNVSIVFVV